MFCLHLLSGLCLHHAQCTERSALRWFRWQTSPGGVLLQVSLLWSRAALPFVNTMYYNLYNLSQAPGSWFRICLPLGRTAPSVALVLMQQSLLQGMYVQHPFRSLSASCSNLPFTALLSPLSSKENAPHTFMYSRNKCSDGFLVLSFMYGKGLVLQKKRSSSVCWMIY